MNIFPARVKLLEPTSILQICFNKVGTIQWSDLPERLWAVTGIQIPNKEAFDSFGKFRNGIQHFAPPPNACDIQGITLRFVFEVIDPLINNCWELYAIDYDEDYDPYVYFVGALVYREILFLVSKEAAECFKYWDVDWSKVSSSYKIEIEQRIEKALKSKI